MATDKAIALGINALKVAFPNYNPDGVATATLWASVLADMPDNTLDAAILALITEKRQFAPSIGEIRAAAMDLHAKAAGIPDAYQAYEEVINMPASMQRKRAEEGPEGFVIHVADLVFTHPIVEATARRLGWPKQFPTENPGVDRGQFTKAYEAEIARTLSDSGRLPALQEYINERRAEFGIGAMPAISDQIKGITKKLTYDAAGQMRAK